MSSSRTRFASPLTAAFTVALTIFAAPDALLAQSSTVVGLTNISPLVAEIDLFSCSASLCTSSLNPVTIPWAGGTAHDGNDGYTWFSDGYQLEKVDTTGGCATICGPFPAPLAAAGSEVTGLAFNEQSSRLFISYASNQIGIFQQTGSCALTPVSICTAPVPPNHVITGLATSDVTGELYYSSAPLLGPSSVNMALIHRAQIGNPCGPFCVFPVFDCAGTFLTVITGLGFDGCRQSLLVTDAANVYSFFIDTTCASQPLSCCSSLPNTAGERLVGLCVLPPPVVATGPVCFGGISPVCASITHSLNGDPVLGNINFSIDLDNAPSGSTAYLFLDIGFPGPGIFSPPLCSGILVTNFFSAGIAVGAPGCNGSASVPFPLPVLPFLCGITLSSQWIGEIPPALAGHYVTPALTWTITSS